MIHRFLAAAALLLMVVPAYAQSTTAKNSLWNDVPQNSTNCKVGPCAAPYVGAPPLGYQQLTSLGSATSLTVPAGAVEALIVCESQTVRWRDDGSAPTASVGMPLTANTPFPYTGNLSALQIIQTTASATCNVSYYK